MKMKLIAFAAIIFLPFNSLALAELGGELNNDTLVSNLYIDISSTAFFDNLEFVNNIQKGYTLTGFNCEPRLRYDIGQRYSISAGAYTLFYSGESGFNKVVPVVTLHTFLSDKVGLNIGTIDGKKGHGLPEPIYKPERVFLNQPETGMQFILRGKYFDGETWINWEKFLFFGDTIQEEFTVGVSGKVKLMKDADVRLSIPLYLLAVHQGGQINVTESKVSTLANFGGGVNFSFPVGENRKAGATVLTFLGRDLSPNPHHVYKKGWAIYPQLNYQTTTFLIEIGYWKANSLILPRGQEIFGSVSTVDPSFNSPQRELVTANFVYSKTLVKGFNLGGKVQLYHDLTESQMDFRFAIIARFDEQFLLNWGK